MRAGLLICSMLCATAFAAPDPSPDFLNFPHAGSVSGAAEAAAFAWKIEQAGESSILFAKAPDFVPRQLYSKTDADGQPVSSVELSADGRFVVFRTGEPMWGQSAYNPASLIEPPQLVLWAIATEPGATARRIGVGTGAKFAASGAKFLYRQGEDLHIVDLNDPTGGSSAIPHGAKLGAAEWAPDGRSLAFTQGRGGYALLGQYRFGADRIDWLVAGADRLSVPHWSPDGKRIAYLRMPGREHSRAYDTGASEPFALEVVDVATRSVRTLWQAPGPAMFPYPDDPDTSVRWLDNERLAFYSEHDGWGRLYGIDASGGSPRAITPANCEVAESEGVSAGRLLVVHNCPDLNTRHLSLVDPRTGKRRDVQSSDVLISNVASSGGRFAAYRGGDADAAPLLRVLDVQEMKVVFSERPADFGYAHRFTAPAPEVVSIQAEDGGISYGQLYLPKSPGRHPAIVWFHGGPYQQNFPSHQGYQHAMNRRLAELGYVVLGLNYRGSEGYGLKMREHPQRAWRGASEVRDAVAAARWLAARADVDGSRIGAWGGSYGGLMTLQSLARHSDLFKAGVALYPLTDWSFSSENSGWWDPSRDFGVSNATRQLAFESSPVAMLDRWTSPVLLFTGDADIYVDVAHTVDLTQRLRAHGVDVRTSLLPNESHGFVLHSTNVRLWNELFAFFAEHLGSR